MKKLHLVQLDDQTKQQLLEITRTGTHQARTLYRARVLLLAHDGKTDAEIADLLQLSVSTCQRLRRNYHQGGLEAALYDQPRPGRPPLITGEVEAELVLLACSEPPAGHASWTLQMLADKLVALELVPHISDVAVMKRLKKTQSSLGRSRRGASRRLMPSS